MRDALEIFRKDVRHLWPQIAGFLLLAAIYCFLDASAPHRTRIVESGPPLPGLLVFAGAWYLVAAAIHEEKLVGDRQYWLTRPISWRSLLLAKAFFVLAFFNAPLLISQTTALAANGIPPLPLLPAILMRQAWLTLVIAAPAAVLAAVTRGMIEFVLASFAVFAALSIALPLLGNAYEVLYWWGPMEWLRVPVQHAVLLGVLIIAMLIQYSRRRTWIARAVVSSALMFAVLAPPIPARLSATGWGKNPSNIRLAFDSQRQPLGFGSRPWGWAGANTVLLMIPVRVAGVPPDDRLVSEHMRATVDSATGERLDRGWPTLGGLVHAEGGYWVGASIDRRFFDRNREEPVQLRVSVALTLLGQPAVAPLALTARAHPTPGLGLCSVLWTQPLVTGRTPRTMARFRCFAPITAPDWVSSNLEEAPRNLFYRDNAGFSAWNTGVDEGIVRPGGIELEIRHAEAHFELALTLRDFRMGPWEVARSGGSE
jgi:hypothetical protein